MKFVEPIRDVEKIKDIELYLQKKHGEKMRIMFLTGIYTGLRVSDILKLRVRDVKGKSRISIKEQKTGKERIIAINPVLKKAYSEYCKEKENYEALIPTERSTGISLSRTYAWRILHEAGKQFGIDSLGTHSMRKTFGYHFYLQTQDTAILQKIFNHSSEGITLRYIGIDQKRVEDVMLNFKYK